MVMLVFPYIPFLLLRFLFYELFYFILLYSDALFQIASYAGNSTRTLL